MSEEAASPAGYEAAKRRLVECLRPAFVLVPGRAARFKAMRKELGAVADALLELADRVESGAAWSDLEEAFGRPPDEPAGTKGVAWSMRRLADAAHEAATGYGDPRAQPWLPWAALVFLHLRHRYRLPMPTNYTLHPAVGEFAELLAQACGAERGVDRALALLKDARKVFDPHMPPAGFEEID